MKKTESELLKEEYVKIQGLIDAIRIVWKLTDKMPDFGFINGGLQQAVSGLVGKQQDLSRKFGEIEIKK